jgi:mannosyl-oligosaccharide alpha-1,2-mannosidase
MANSFLLPMHYMQTKTVSKVRSRYILNEKFLLLLLLIVSISTIFLIVMNLPSDVQRYVNRDKIKNVFIPEFNSQYQRTHQVDHQHQAPLSFLNAVTPLKKSDTSEAVPTTTADLNEKVNNVLAQKNDYELSVTEKRNKIKEMALFGWRNYEKYAWGENELKPLTRVGHSAGIFGASTKLGATIVDGLDTMYLMGYEEEYQRGREWILKNLNLKVDAEFSAFEINIRFIGGLLSIYTLTEDKVHFFILNIYFSDISIIL